jgi:hypothetical protein
MSVLVSAQDVLYKTDNTKLEVKVMEVNEASVKYKLKSYPDGPLYTVSKKEVSTIVYQNGSHEVIKQAATVVPQYYTINYADSISRSRRLKRYERMTTNKNVFFVNAIELLNSGIGVSYLREFGEGRFDLHAMYASSFKTPEMDNALFDLGGGRGHKIAQTHYDIGLGLYFNTRGKSSVTHFIGPMIRNAQYSGTTNYWFSEPNTYYMHYNTATFTMNETSLLINNGFLYRITPRFNMMIHFAVGKFINRTYSENVPESDHSGYGVPRRDLALHAGFHLGYRF